MFITLDSEIKQRLIALFIIIGAVISPITAIIICKSKYPNECKIMTTKIETVDKNSIEFFIGNNTLDKTYNKIKNSKFDEINLIDKQKLNDALESYNRIGYKYISIDGTKIKLNDFLKSNDKDIKKYLSSVDGEIQYFTIFYKIVVDKDTSYANYLDKNISDKLVKQAVKNKQITDTRVKMLIDKFSIITLSIYIIILIVILIFDNITRGSEKYNSKVCKNFNDL